MIADQNQLDAAPSDSDHSQGQRDEPIEKKIDQEAQASAPKCCSRLRAVAIGVAVLVVALVVIGVSLYLVQNSIQAAAIAESGDTTGPEIVVTNKKENPGATATDKTTRKYEHPIDPALEIASAALERSQKEIHDYTATAIKRERINGKLGEEQYMFCKIRNRKLDKNGEIVVPLSVYLKYLKPKSTAGREVIWVENQNGGKLIAHEPGIFNLVRVPLDPKGWIAMNGQRYSIDNIGIENLISKLIERGARERKHKQCDVTFTNGAKVDDRVCTLIQLRHPEQKPEYAFYKAEIFIDDERDIPLRYAAYLWPETPGGEPLVDEEYTYMDVKLNVGLTDADFDPDNPDYNYP